MLLRAVEARSQQGDARGKLPPPQRPHVDEADQRRGRAGQARAAAAHPPGRRPGGLECTWTAQRGDGRDVPGRVPQFPQGTQTRVMTESLWAALSEIQDPEMPVNLVDLGVIYDVRRQNGTVDVDLTFTAMGCPASEFILDDVRERLLREEGVSQVRINIVWDPPWTAARMTQAGRDALEAWGLAV